MIDDDLDIVTDDDEPTGVDQEVQEAQRTIEEGGAAASAAGAGLAARLRAGARHLEERRKETFPIPDWDDDLKVRFKKLTEVEIEKADTPLKLIAHATDVVLIRENASQPYQELTWRQIGDHMGVPSTTPITQIISGVFDHNAVAVRVFHVEVVAWMSGKQDVIQRALGE